MDFARSASGLIVPANLADKPACAKCFICQEEFTRPQDCERHMHKCIDRNADMLRALLPRGPNDRTNWDTEYEAWARGGETPWANWYDEHRLNPDGSPR
jgi:hypothetical protein